MRGEKYITKKEQYDSVYKNGSNRSNRELVIRVLPNQLENSRIGITVSRAVGKAVVRNRIKRLIRETVRKISPNPGYDIVFIARPATAITDCRALRQAVVHLLSRAQVLVEKNEEFCVSCD